MTEQTLTVSASPRWVDISSRDPKATQAFYSQLMGWNVQDLGPEAGNYAFFMKDGKMVAGAGPTQSEQQPTVWSVYIGTPDADATVEKATAAGGTVIAPPMDVMDAGRMAIIQDPTGAFISVWQPKDTPGIELQHEPGAFDWAELTARGFDRARAFYERVFGWTVKESDFGEMIYHEFQVDGSSVAGGIETPSTMPAEVPSYWMAYFQAADLDATHRRAEELGATTMVPPHEFPGGRFAIFTDPQGAAFGLTGK